ncbi:hypothetical protein VZT92_002882 [Zoarces viviparus]|uniref:Uncharacterized protein n=1 Tax=Zoarces viviparus TaxID=48416 RepID=A0AAW1G1B6_ZOAVI
MEGGLEAGKEDGVVDGVEGCAEVEQYQDVEGVFIRGEEEVVGDFDEGSFCAVMRSESGLKWFIQLV